MMKRGHSLLALIFLSGSHQHSRWAAVAWSSTPPTRTSSSGNAPTKQHLQQQETELVFAAAMPTKNYNMVQPPTVKNPKQQPDERRRFLQSVFASSTSILVSTAAQSSTNLVAWADDASFANAPEITDRMYIQVKGLPVTPDNAEAKTRRIVIGLYGKTSPQSVAQLKALASTTQGLSMPCRPRAERTMQKEQLEANKVYNRCIEEQDEGVKLVDSSIWRVVRDERIDVGAVAGKFVAREYPTWQEEPPKEVSLKLKHDAPGVVSVRRGNDGGFGFTIYPGGKKDVSYLDEDHIVVGRVVEGMDVVEQLNQVPVIASSKVNYMALTGGTTTKNAPSRACQYGGAMYCNENKPLIKLGITETGVL